MFKIKLLTIYYGIFLVMMRSGSGASYRALSGPSVHLIAKVSKIIQNEMVHLRER